MKLDNSVAKTLQEQANLFAKFFNSAFIISSQPSCLEKQEHSVKQIIHNIEPDRNLIAKLCNDLDLSKLRGPEYEQHLSNSRDTKALFKYYR